MKIALDFKALASEESLPAKPIAIVRGGFNTSGLPKVSNSQVQTFLTCRKKWHYNYARGWVTRNPPKAMAMGDYMHGFFDIFYQMLQANPTEEPESLWDTLEEVILESLKADGSNGEEVLRAMKAMRRYVLEVSPRIDCGITVIGSEMHFEAPLTTPKGRDFLLEGYVDLLYKDRNGQLIVRDHKTTGKGGKDAFWKKEEVAADPQQSTYISGLRVLDFPVFSGEVNQIVTFNYKDYLAKPIDTLFCCVRAFRTDEQIESAKRWYGRIVDAMLDETDHLESIEKGRCSYCFYRDPCSKQQQGKDDEQILQLGFRRKDGWSEYHASETSS